MLSKLEILRYAQNDTIELTRYHFIDKEYIGHEGVIKDVLRGLFQKYSKDMPIVHFDHIGKKSKAHQVAIKVFRGERKADIIIKAKDLLELFF